MYNYTQKVNIQKEYLRRGHYTKRTTLMLMGMTNYSFHNQEKTQTYLIGSI